MRFRIFRSAEDKQYFKMRLALAAISLIVVGLYVASIVVSVYAGREGVAPMGRPDISPIPWGP
jgi:hypothetical protein